MSQIRDIEARNGPWNLEYGWKIRAYIVQDAIYTTSKINRTTKLSILAKFVSDSNDAI